MGAGSRPGFFTLADPLNGAQPGQQDIHGSSVGPHHPDPDIFVVIGGSRGHPEDEHDLAGLVFMSSQQRSPFRTGVSFRIGLLGCVGGVHQPERVFPGPFSLPVDEDLNFRR